MLQHRCAGSIGRKTARLGKGRRSRKEEEQGEEEGGGRIMVE